ncbi:S-layer homology domain-containing protein [uncultured Arthrobacter sp.]|uniref:S-layer homology domain-containing protein n=1 Tax=uncultured Arthrobacter sp. TaxID=114050 RepID=UPI00345B7953
MTQAPFLEPYAVGMDPADGETINYYAVTQVAATASMLPNRNMLTQILGYNGIFPGPTISVERGTKAVLRVRNQMPATHPRAGHALYSSTHLHGSASLPQFDGYANDLTFTGFVKDYQYPNNQPARTLWYHDHAVHNTAPNVYSGLVAQYHMHDEIERTLLPQGKYDVALTISDAMFAENGELGYDDNDHSGLYGDVILVNGQPWPVLQVERRIYRFRVLNGCLSRSFRFRLSTGEPVVMVATDGGLMPYAQTVEQWRHASAERYEILVDFRNYQPGQRIELVNLSNDNNVDYDHTNKVMAFDVVDSPVDTKDSTWNTIPYELDPGNEIMALKAEDAVTRRHFRLKRDDVTNVWSIDGQSWGDVIASNYQKVIANPELNSTEIWELENSSGGWFHPMHIHLVDFKIIGGEDRATYAYEQGPKDVVYVGEGETVRLLMKFGPHRGRYMVHCHNLPHEDHDMMVQFRVGAAELEPAEIDPNLAAPCYWDDGTVPPSYPPAPEFKDVPPGTQFRKEIGWLAVNGITTGWPDQTFRPLAPVSREAMAAFLYRLCGKPEHEVENTFKDVPASNPFRLEISWLAEEEITTGYDDGTYRPLGSVSREAMAAFLYRIAGEPDVESAAVFLDVLPGHQFYREISWLASTGITTGYPDGTFRPGAAVARDAIAAFLYRYSQKFGRPNREDLD